MGLFDTINKQKKTNKKAEWKQGLIPTIVELKDDHMAIITATTEDIVFYQDIMFLECVVNVVNIRTNVKRYALRSGKLRGGSERADKLHSELLEKIAQSKNQ